MYEMGVGEPNRFFLSEQTSGLILPIKLSINFLNVKQHYFSIVIFISFLYALERDHTHRVSWTNKINNSVFDDTYVNIRFSYQRTYQFPLSENVSENVSKKHIRGPYQRTYQKTYQRTYQSRGKVRPLPPSPTQDHIIFCDFCIYFFLYSIGWGRGGKALISTTLSPTYSHPRFPHIISLSLFLVTLIILLSTRSFIYTRL